MKNKFFIGSVIPTLACLAVIGSGFSIWMFDQETSSTETNGKGNWVTSVITIGSLSVKDSGMNLVFDQTASKLNTTAQGIHFTKATNSENFESCVYTYNKEDYNLDYVKDLTEVYFKTTITIPKGINKYLNITEYTHDIGEVTNYSGDEFGTFTYIVKASEIEDYDTNKVNGITTFDWSNIKIEYKNEPTTLSEYKAMREAVKGESITTTYSASFSRY